MAFGGSAPNSWKVVDSESVSRLQLFCSSPGLSCSVGTAASSARVASRLLSIQAIACGLQGDVAGVGDPAA